MILADLGAGKGSGMALMFLFTSIAGLIISLSGCLIDDVRNIEENVLDYDVVTTGS